MALVPGTGEYALATEPVRFRRGKGDSAVLNVHNDRGLPDLMASLDQLAAELPNAESVSLVVTWFGDDLRCDRCTLRPKVEQGEDDGDPMPWVVSGLARAAAPVVSRLDGRPIFGGTPADASVVQAIATAARQRQVGDVLPVHPDGHLRPGTGSPTLDGRDGPAPGPVAGADHAGAGAGAGRGRPTRRPRRPPRSRPSSGRRPRRTSRPRDTA